MRPALLFLLISAAAAQQSGNDAWVAQQTLRHRLEVDRLSTGELDMQIARRKHEDFLRKQFESKLEEFFFAANAFSTKYWETKGLVTSVKPGEQKKWMVKSFDAMVKAYRALEKADPSFDRILSQETEKEKE